MSFNSYDVDAVFICDIQGTILDVNEKGCDLTGYNRASLINKNVRMIIPEPHKSLHSTYLNSFIETGIPKIICIGRQVEVLKADSNTTPVYLTVKYEKGYFIGVLHDRTSQIKLLDSVYNRLEKLEKRA